MSIRLRYPGSKHKAAPDLASLFPLRFSEYREPFCGSAASLWHVPRTTPRWINDVNPAVVNYFTALRDDPQFIDRLFQYEQFAIAGATALQDAYKLARYKWLTTGDSAAYWFLNQYAYGQFVRLKRKNVATFSLHHIRAGKFPLGREDAENCRAMLQGVKITCGDYSALLDAPGKDVLLFLDPPYYGDSVLYDADGDYLFHVTLRDKLLTCPHRFLLTIGDSELTHHLYGSLPWRMDVREYRYSSMLARAGRDRSNELVIRNYDGDDKLIHA